jgi:hypothetical protein
MTEENDYSFIEKITFPDGVYCKIDAYAYTFNRNIETVKKLASEGKLKRRKLKGEWYIRMYK